MLILKLIPGLQGLNWLFFLNLCGASVHPSPGTGQLTKLLGTLVVDELHLVGDASRGYLLEIFLSKAGCWLQGITFLHHLFKHVLETCACFFCCNLRDFMGLLLPNLRQKKGYCSSSMPMLNRFFLWLQRHFFLTLFSHGLQWQVKQLL